MKFMTTFIALSILASGILFAAETYQTERTNTNRQSTNAYAEDNSKTLYEPRNLNKSIMDHDVYLYRAKEWSADIFGTYAFTDSGGRYQDGFGGGLGVNYFFTRYVGLGLEGYAWDGSDNDPVGVVSGNVILRLPFDQYHFAPYIFAGPGGHFGPTTEFSGQFGGGIEYRFNNRVGIFTDARYTLTENSNDYFLPRVGLRFIF